MSEIEKPVDHVYKDEQGSFRLTEAGREALSPLVTNLDEDIFAITTDMSPLTAASAMARYSRFPGGLREVIGKEFITDGKDEELLERVVNQFGDDSVKQLAFGAVAIEGASNLLTKQIEWGRLAGYLEQSTRYIYYDRKDEDGNYRYFIPDHYGAELTDTYTTTMDGIFDKYSEMVRGVSAHLHATKERPTGEDAVPDAVWNNSIRAQACDAVRMVLPVATKSNVGVVGSGHAIENLVIGLMSGSTPEARETGQAVLDEMREVLSVFLAKTDHPERGGAVIDYKLTTDERMRDVRRRLLPNAEYFLEQPSLAELVDVSHDDEMAVVPHMLHEYTGMSLSELQEVVDEMTPEQRKEVFDAYVGERLNRRHKPGRAFEKLHYTWDIVCDYGIFRDLQRHRIVDELTWQELTPFYGYEEPPQEVIDAGYEEMFRSCYDDSNELYKAIIEEEGSTQAQYATLLGHRMRWKVTYNAREAFHLHELRTAPQGHPGYRRLVSQMHDELAKVHPNTAAAMKFVNQGEDEELTRLAAEKALDRKRREMGLGEMDYDA